MGGSGRRDASSSASRWLVGDQRESRASEERRPSSDSVVGAAELSAALTPSREAGLRDGIELTVEILRACVCFDSVLLRILTERGGTEGFWGADARRGFSRRLPDRMFVFEVGEWGLSGSETRLARTVPASLRWNQLMKGLLDLRGTCLGNGGIFESLSRVGFVA